MTAGMVGRDETESRRKRLFSGKARLAAELLSTTALAGATALFGLAASAGANEWTGALSSDWFTAGNWVGGVPTGTDLVTIDPASGIPVLIDGAAAEADDMYLGLFNSGELTILNGGTLTNSGFGQVGYGFVTTGMVTVTGAGSMWTAADMITVGYGGTGEVNLTDGGTLLAGDLTLGANSGATGTVTVSGTGSFLSAAAIVIGDEGTGTLTVEDGASALASGLTSLGLGVGGMGTMVVTGAGSSFSSFDNLIVGNQGEGELWIADGATVTVADIFAGYAGGADGLIHIQGTNATLNAQGLYLGNAAGASGGLLMSDGAKLNTIEGSLGDAAGSTGIASLTGAGTFWSNSAALIVGEDGNASLAVSDGAGIGTGTFQVGENAGSIGIASVSGSGSAINVLNAATVGNAGEGLLTVGGGATFDVSGDLTVGGLAGGVGAVLATGTGTTVSLNNLTVADAGQAIVHVQNGATVDAGLDLTIAADAGSTGYLFLGGTSGGATQGAGTLLAANGITFGAGTGALIFQHTGADYQFGLDIAGSGQIFALEGVTRYGGDGSGFSGMTEIYGGATLDVLGTLLGTTSVLSGGRLGGDGILELVDVQSGGTFAPGNSIGTVDVADVTFAAGSVYEVEVNSIGDSDLIDAAGTATINGGTVDVLAFPDYALGTAYTILTAGAGVTGVFDGATASVFVTPTLTYDANNAYVTLAQTASFADVALTPNQIAAAGGAESLGAGNALFDAILVLGSAAEAQAAFDAVSGEIHASLRTALVEDSRFVREAANERIRAAFEGVAAEAAPLLAYGEDGPTIAPADAGGLALWGRLFGSFGHWESDGNAAALDRSTGGFLAGGDALVGEVWRLGLLAGYSRTSFDADDRACSGDSDNIHLGVYGGTKLGALGLRFGSAYSWHDVDTSRMAAFTGFADTLTAGYDAGTAQVFAEAGYEIRAGGARFEPFANLAYVDLRTDGFTEGGGAAALSSASSSTDTTFATLGLRAETGFTLGGMMAEARATLGWRHAFGDLVPTAGLAFAGGTAFTIAGVPIAEDALVLEAGVDLRLAPTATLGLDYSGQIGSGMSDHAFKASLGVGY